MSDLSNSGPTAAVSAASASVGTGAPQSDMAPMTPEAVLEALTYIERGASPRYALEAALGMREELTPHLVRVLSLAPVEVQALADNAPDEDSCYFLHEMAMYLLAAWCEPQAWRLILDFFVSDDDVAMGLMGIGTEADLAGMLVRCYDGSDPAYLERIITTDALDPLFRQVCVEAYHGLVLQCRLPYPRFISFLVTQLDPPADAKPGDWYDWLAFRAARVQEPALRPTIEALLDRGLTVYGDTVLSLVSRAQLDRLYADDPEAIRAEIFQDFVFEDLPGTISKWSWFQPQDDAIVEAAPDELEMGEFQPPFVREHRKLGRNELCHCGSGRKYKKCCLEDDRQMLG
jgi:hypothetical protein